MIHSLVSHAFTRRGLLPLPFVLCLFASRRRFLDSVRLIFSSLIILILALDGRATENQLSFAFDITSSSSFLLLHIESF